MGKKRSINDLLTAEEQETLPEEYRDSGVKPLTSYERNRLARWRADRPNRIARLEEEQCRELRRREVAARAARVDEALKRHIAAAEGINLVARSLQHR